jgi:hypothetical protein
MKNPEIPTDDLKYGVPFDNTGDGKPDLIMAPFCWPKVDGVFTTDQDMTGTVYLNVADAMDRGALWTEIKDASNGQPLDKAWWPTTSSVPSRAALTAGLCQTVAAGFNWCDQLPVASAAAPPTT